MSVVGTIVGDGRAVSLRPDGKVELAWPDDEVLSAQQSYTAGPFPVDGSVAVKLGLFAPLYPLRRRTRLGAWFYRGEHRLRRTSQITVAELKEQARRERPVVPVSPIFLGTRTARFYPVGHIVDGFIRAEPMAATLAIAPLVADVIDVPLVADEADTGPVIVS